MQAPPSRPLETLPQAGPGSDPWAGLTVLERGWLSSNNIVLHGAPGEGATLVDSGHLVHAEQTLALLDHALQGEPLARLINTHLHSDHCGGNATLQRAHGVPVWIPPGDAAAVRAWDEDALSYRATGQLCERFHVDTVLQPGQVLAVNGRHWQVLAAPGHDPHAIMLFDAAHGVLISADALWENGFGVVFPELDGVAAFDEVGATLDLIAALPVQLVIPGHGAPFTDVAGALARARRRLAGHIATPARHARFAAKVLIKYHLMELRRQRHVDLLDWAEATPLLHRCHARAGLSDPVRETAAALVDELHAQGALQVVDGWVLDAG